MKNLLLKYFLLAVVLIASSSFAFSANDLRLIGQVPAATNLFEPFELRFLYLGSFTDPYNPKEIRLDATITLPSGKIISYPGYFDGQLSIDSSKWALKFTPFEPGVHIIKIQMQNGSIKFKTENLEVKVTPGSQPGFLHLPAGNPAAFNYVFDSGKPFRGIGMNFGWESRHNIDTIYNLDYYEYDSFLAEMSNLGMNFFRTWMCPWNLPLEWNEVDSHRYTNEPQYRYNQSAIRKMDELVKCASEEDIYFMLTLDYHGALKTEEDYFGGNNYWLQHPYNKKNGGSCEKPADFFTDKTARERYKDRLRFILARWGYSPNIAVIELWNEVDNAMEGENIPAEVVVAWHKEMAAYFKSIDPYQHLVSTSTSHRPVKGLFELPEIDFSQTHMYGHTDKIDHTIAGRLAVHKKPTIIGEIGFDWRTPEASQVLDYKNDLYLSLWRGLFNEAPVLPMSWWWEYLYENKALGVFSVVSDFSSQMLKNDQFSLERVATKSSKGLEVKALKASSGIYAWVNNVNQELNEYELSLTVDVNKKAKCSWVNIETGEKSPLEKVRIRNGKINFKWKKGTMPDGFAMIIE